MLDYCSNNSIVSSQFRFEYAHDFSEGLANVTVNGRSGFIVKDGSFVIPPVYNSELCYIFGKDIPYYLFNEGLAIVSFGENPHRMYGCINHSGDIVVSPAFSCLHPFSEGMAAFQEGGVWGFIDIGGKKVIPSRFESAGDFHDGLAPVKIATNKYYYINKEGKEVLTKTSNLVLSFDEYFPGGRAMFQNAHNFCDGLARVTCYEKNGVIDTSGRFREEKTPVWMKCSEGLAVVHEGGKRGYRDSHGDLIIPCRFDDAAPFHEGIAAVILNGKVGYIDRCGSFIIKPTFDKGRNFHEGLAAVEKDGRWGYIDRSGEQVI